MEENKLLEPYASAYPLFPNAHNNKLSRVAILAIVKKYAAMARAGITGIPANIGCHSLRHSKAMHMLEAGINLIYIGGTGHATTTTTEIYMSKRQAENGGPKENEPINCNRRKNNLAKGREFIGVA